MANKFHTYFGQIVTDAELNEIHDSLFDAISRFVEDFGFRGIVAGGTVTQHSPTNLTVNVSAPTIVYDQNSNRMQFDAPVNLNLAVDENAAATTVSGSLNEKWLSIFIEFTSTTINESRIHKFDELAHRCFCDWIGLRKLIGGDFNDGTLRCIVCHGG